MAQEIPNPGMAPGSVAADTLDRAASAAHSAVDRAIGATAPAAQWLDRKTRTQQQLYDTAAEYVSENPVKALAMAFVAGVLVGKIIL
jgi:ElaB/YqjD/DUF883 family membrane-anchored ribosome-binding protein